MVSRLLHLWYAGPYTWYWRLYYRLDYFNQGWMEGYAAAFETSARLSHESYAAGYAQCKRDTTRQFEDLLSRGFKETESTDPAMDQIEESYGSDWEEASSGKRV